MLRWALIFFIVALVAALFGFAGCRRRRVDRKDPVRGILAPLLGFSRNGAQGAGCVT
jgi:hypothetical protein